MTENERIILRLPAIKDLMDDCGIAIDHIEFIPGGKTNESYIVYGDDGKRYLARIAGPGTEKFIDRKKEIYNVAAADRIGVGPRLLCAKDNNFILEYVEGTCTTSQDALYFDDNVHKLTEQMRRLHSSQESFKGKFSFQESFAVYKRDFLSTGYPIPTEMKLNEPVLFDMMKWVDEQLSEDVCPVHSDIVMQNIIFTKDRVFMIDWEYSTMSDRYLDLASFCAQNILAPGAERMFLKSYFAKSDIQLDYGKLLLFKMSISFMWVYWYLNNIAHNKDLDYNEFRWRMHLNHAISCKEIWETIQK